MSPLPTSGFIFGIGVVLIAVAIIRRLLANPKGRLPPGPKGLPLIGNVGDLPPPGQPEHFHWLKFKDKYGPIASITVFGQPIVILHDHALTLELLEKRSSIYSERPQSFFATEMCGWAPWIGFQGNNSLMRSYRRDIHSVVGNKVALERVMPLEETEAKRFLIRAMREPDDWESHVKKYTASVILNVAYGYRVSQNGSDPLVELVEKSMPAFSDSATPGRWLVDSVHWLQYVPSWFPGGGFKRTAERYYKLQWDSGEVPYRFTEARVEEGRSEPCLVADLLHKVDRKNLSQDDHDRIMRSAGALYLGGSDTVSDTARGNTSRMLTSGQDTGEPQVVLYHHVEAP